MDPRLCVGILPASEHRARGRLWAALEGAYPVRFEGRGEDDLRGVSGVGVDGFRLDRSSLGGLHGVIALGIGGIPRMGIPSLILHGEEAGAGASRSIAFTTHPALPRALHGALLSDAHATALSDLGANEVVLATLDDAPAWVLDQHDDGGADRGVRGRGHVEGASQRVACAPAELGVHEALRERLAPGRCLALLALAHFLATLTAHLRPPPPPLHAAFVIDDPNLRRPRYGHLDYADVLQHARLHGYHLAVALVPLDTRFAHPRATRIFREGSAHLSLCVHGNDHHGAELGRPRSDPQAVALVAQALRRSASFERRTGVAVDRVMVPPHERLSEPVARALHSCGFQAVSTTRPYPWVADRADRSWLARPSGVGPLAAWGPVDVVAGGLPVLLRADLREHPREDLVLRAFLGQPLILYGHHDLFADGPDALAQAAAQIDRLGDVRWCSLGDIARAAAPGRAPGHSLQGSPAGRPLDPDALAAIPSPPRRLVPLLRRLASEGRDRVRRDRVRPAPGSASARGARPRSLSGRR